MCASTPSSESLRVEVQRRGAAAVVCLVGSANMDVAEHLQEQLIELVDANLAQLVLDLSGLSFVSSVGLGAIVAAHVHCHNRSCQLKLAAPPPKIMELLEVTRLTKLLPVYDSVENALVRS